MTIMFEILEPIDKYGSFYWNHVCLLNMMIQLISNIMYAVESKLLLPPVQKYYVISRLKNVVKLINNIDTFFTCRYS